MFGTLAVIIPIPLSAASAATQAENPLKTNIFSRRNTRVRLGKYGGFSQQVFCWVKIN